MAQERRRDLMAIGHRLWRIRRRLGLGQAELALIAGVTPQQITNYELGRHRIPFARVIQMANALGLKVGDFVPDAEDEREAARLKPRRGQPPKDRSLGRWQPKPPESRPVGW